jgi:hypothetical protein
MVIQSWIITGLVAGFLASILFVVSGAANETNVTGIVVVLGTMILITIIRKFARSQVA